MNKNNYKNGDLFENKTPLTMGQDGSDWMRILLRNHNMDIVASGGLQPYMRLVRLDEIHDEKYQAYRQALANVYASMNADEDIRLVYILNGTPFGVSLYLGVAADSKACDVHEAIKNLRGALDGQLPGINFGEEVDPEDHEKIFNQYDESSYQGILLGVPTLGDESPDASEHNFQGIDRLIRTLQASYRSDNRSTASWRLTVVSQPLAKAMIQRQLEEVYTACSRLAGMVRTSVQVSGNTSKQNSFSKGLSKAEGENSSVSNTLGTNEGATETKSWGESTGKNDSYSSSGKNSGDSQAKNLGTSKSKSKTQGFSQTETATENASLSNTEGSSLGVTHEISNKQAQYLLESIEKQFLPRLQKGLTKGLFQTAVYLHADTKSTFQRLKSSVRATFQGSDATISPLQVIDLPRGQMGHGLSLPKLGSSVDSDALLVPSLFKSKNHHFGTLLTAEELSTVASLPGHEVQGIRRRKRISFAVDLPDNHAEDNVMIGDIIDRGRCYSNNPIQLSKKDLNKHVFVTGVTGAGKTTTCLKLLIESDLPFLVIEPAKTEYRALVGRYSDGIQYYRPNGDKHQSLRINPFALIRHGQNIKSHAGFLKNVFTAVFPMEASMPAMVEAAILKAYEEKGWDIDENEYQLAGNPFDALSRAWPTMSDMIRQLDILIPTYGLGKEFEEKYRGSLVSRLRSMTDGTLGRVLDVPQSIDFEKLLDSRVVVELEELQGGDEKALMMAFLLGCINEAIRHRFAQDSGFRHLTLIEEAHRLLSRPEAGDKAASMAVEAFADMLAEVRKYGEGLIIADQIPAKLIPDVIKNTHTKIVHRLFAEDDRRTMGEAMMMSEEQRNYLPNLAAGEAIVFCGGWHGSAHAAIRNDGAQTDGAQARNVDIDECGLRQLWSNRKRYYAELCSLAWVNSFLDTPKIFAQFVREARQAQNQFLKCLPAQDKLDTATLRAEDAYRKVRTWLDSWSEEIAMHGSDSGNVLNIGKRRWPEDKLAAAWMALLLDANPLIKAQKEMANFNTLQKSVESGDDYLYEAITALFECLRCAATRRDFFVKSKKNRNLNAHLSFDLSNFHRI